MRTKRRIRRRKKYQGLFLSLKVALICYLFIFSASYMTSNTSAYLSSRAEMGGTITAWVAPVIRACGEENEMENDAVLGEAIGSDDLIDAPRDEANHDSSIENETNSEDIQTGTPSSENEDDALPGGETISEEESQIETLGEDIGNDMGSGGETTAGEVSVVDTPKEEPVNVDVSDSETTVVGENQSDAAQNETGSDTSTGEDTAADGETSQDEPVSDVTPDDGATDSGGDQIDTPGDVLVGDLVEGDQTDCGDLVEKSDEADPEPSNDIIAGCGDEDVEGEEEQEIVEAKEEQEIVEAKEEQEIVEAKEEQEIVEAMEEQDIGEANVDCGIIDKDSKEGTEMVEVIEDEKATDQESENPGESDSEKIEEDLNVNREEKQETPEEDIQIEPDIKDESIQNTEQESSVEGNDLEGFEIKEVEESSTSDGHE